ncbi:acid phosphatase/vanadium-dependent haloperoxidase-related protein [Actinidia rufa]|uniref:Acid phosphatase/vanadium-dependent haloperoxidase-related protein n=1 Tax=Actinidia rufa TaxID=165716 RepID=A0A7J0F392_9ERIC|nr:acid phosphatase/vanadium-dependent haloperoxidase-related protein [Actinidia rufa]
MTIKLNPKQTGNNESATPWQIATDVARAVHSAECDEGIPPDANMIFKSHFFSTKKFRITLIDCAISQAKKAETNVGFAAKVAMNGLNRPLAVDVTLNRAIPNPPFCKYPSDADSDPIELRKIETHFNFEVKSLILRITGNKFDEGVTGLFRLLHFRIGVWGFGLLGLKETEIEERLSLLKQVNLKKEHELEVWDRGYE